MAKKDILVMCQFFYPEYITSSILPFQTAQALVKNGMSVDVLCGYPKEYHIIDQKVPREEFVDGMNIKRINYLQLSRGALVSRLVNYFSFVASMFTQLFKIKNYKIILIYSNPPILPIIAILAHKLFGTKIVFVAYDVYPEIAIETDKLKTSSLITKVMNLINKHLYPNSDVVALSKDMKQFFLKNRNINPDKVHVINNWATEEGKYSSQASPKKESEYFTISYLGNMGIAQDFHTILDAFKSEKIRDAKIQLIFAGHGNKKEKIKEYVEEHNLSNVKVYDYLQGAEFDALVETSDIFFLSLKNRLNGLAVPSKFYTYLLENKPILAVINKNSDIAKEIEEFNLGFYVEEGESQLLVDKILSFKENQFLLANSDVYEKYYSKEKQLEKYVQLFKSILEGE